MEKAVLRRWRALSDLGRKWVVIQRQPLSNQAGENPKSFQINYQNLGNANLESRQDNPYIREIIPETVRGNVKNLHGAERGFLSVYPDVVHVVTHNLSPTVLGRRFGLLVPITYKQLNPNASRESMTQAHILGWGVEMIRGSNTLIKSLIDPPGPKDTPTWSEKHGLGNMAFNDALFLQNGIHVLLKHFFKDDPRYHHFLDAFLIALRATTKGRLISFDDHPSQKPGLAGYSINAYKALVRNNVSAISYCLPISLAFHKFGIHDPQVHKQIRMIFNEVGYFAQINRDYANCYLDPSGADIKNKKLTWLVVMAKQLARDARHRQILEKCYGSDNPEDVEQVLAIYRDLKMKKMVRGFLEQEKQDILQMIQQISKVDKAGLSPEFIFKLIDSMNTLAMFLHSTSTSYFLLQMVAILGATLNSISAQPFSEHDQQGIHHLIELLNQRLESQPPVLPIESHFEGPGTSGAADSWWWSTLGGKPEGVKKAGTGGASTLRIMKKSQALPPMNYPTSSLSSYPNYESIRIMKKNNNNHYNPRVSRDGKTISRPYYDSLRVMKREPTLISSLDVPESLRIMKKDNGPYGNLHDSLRIMKKNVETMENMYDESPARLSNFRGQTFFNRPEVRSGSWNTDLRIL
ncbi:hypothetical protein TCAL_05808 [Tigriopus californicus]|uniref:Uncharacterized protein n=2 Tax=Tigriopus californicus TaxID=6832 RepID=A0A553PQ77_TIGCA|nr:hypothetical protein TCAL_05808 [Tigriopus californicus]